MGEGPQPCYCGTIMEEILNIIHKDVWVVIWWCPDCGSIRIPDGFGSKMKLPEKKQQQNKLSAQCIAELKAEVKKGHANEELQAREIERLEERIKEML